MTDETITNEDMIRAERALAEIEKRSFQAMPGGQPAQDPAAAQGGQPQMDPAQGGQPMDPSQAGMPPAGAAPAGAPPAGSPPAGDPSQGGMPPEMAMLKQMISETMMEVLPQTLQQLGIGPGQGGQEAGGEASGEGSGKAPDIRRLAKSMGQMARLMGELCDHLGIADPSAQGQEQTPGNGAPGFVSGAAGQAVPDMAGGMQGQTPAAGPMDPAAAGLLASPGLTQAPGASSLGQKSAAAKPGVGKAERGLRALILNLRST